MPPHFFGCINCSVIAPGILLLPLVRITAHWTGAPSFDTSESVQPFFIVLITQSDTAGSAAHTLSLTVVSAVARIARQPPVRCCWTQTEWGSSLYAACIELMLCKTLPEWKVLLISCKGFWGGNKLWYVWFSNIVTTFESDNRAIKHFSLLTATCRRLVNNDTLFSGDPSIKSVLRTVRNTASDPLVDLDKWGHCYLGNGNVYLDCWRTASSGSSRGAVLRSGRWVLVV